MIGLAKIPFEVEESSGDFEQTVLPHFDAAYNLARWLTRDASDAQDVVQEAYLRAFRFFGGFQGGDGKSWILRIVRNTCYSWLQKNRSHVVGYELSEDICDDGLPSPELQMIDDDDRRVLREHINRLPEAFREVIVLRDIEGL